MRRGVDLDGDADAITRDPVALNAARTPRGGAGNMLSKRLQVLRGREISDVQSLDLGP